MTAPSSIEPARFLHDHLASASPDLLRSMLGDPGPAGHQRRGRRRMAGLLRRLGRARAVRRQAGDLRRPPRHGRGNWRDPARRDPAALSDPAHGDGPAAAEVSKLLTFRLVRVPGQPELDQLAGQPPCGITVYSGGEVDLQDVFDWSHPPVFDLTGVPPAGRCLPEGWNAAPSPAGSVF